MKRIWVLGLAGLFFFTSCAPDEAAVQATITQIVFEVRQEQTQNAPTLTLTPSLTPTHVPTATPSPSATITQTPTLTVTPVPDVSLFTSIWEAYSGPSVSLHIVYFLTQADFNTAIGRDEACEWVKIRNVEGVEGWVQNDPQAVRLNFDCAALPLGTYLPVSGSIIFDKRYTEKQNSFLWVTNGLNDDAVILLTTLSDQPVYGYYVGAGHKEKLEYVPYGSYKIFFTSGEGWLASEFCFSENAHYEVFEDILSFNSSNYWTLELYSASEGNADTDVISEEDFPSLGGE